MVAVNPSDIAIIIIVALVLFVGSSKIPELFRSMGRALGEFKKGRMEAEMEINQMQSQQSQPNVQQSQKSVSAEDLEKQIRDLQNQLDQLKKQQGTK
ncbi:twin-arginine translocase TatA/TatE family subunit [Metallosphaera sedula]|uniref:twin-arginine translocase TatA/TatE family subunit n=1 Tax=Metallosphaera sedula TaxID=43687 RepID=UPI0020BD7202|nr:twin-arginine translocase TatA/TatE family subunit [Metallosphaera sedula]BBL46809.1 Sec-independent protein translocase protein TatA [Metallosphaera sedula]